MELDPWDYVLRLSPGLTTILRERISRHVDSEPFRIIATYSISYNFSPVSVETDELEHLMLIQTMSHTGQCFLPEPMSLPSGLIGADCRSLAQYAPRIRLCGLDAAIGAVKTRPESQTNLSGSSSKKMVDRTRLVAGELEHLAEKLQVASPTVACIGAVGSIISILRSFNWNVLATDLNSKHIGKYFGDVQVLDGSKHNEAAISASDFALVTGMTLSTFTLREIIAAAAANRTPMVMFSETCSNIMPHLVGYPVVSVISEQFPFYMFPGVSSISVYRDASWSIEKP